MRWRVASSVLVAVTALSACHRASPTVAGAGVPEFSIHQLPPSPSTLSIEVQSGAVQGLIPGDWDAVTISPPRFPAQGFVPSPQLEDGEGQAGVVRGMEAFWIDVGNLEVASDYYYAVARGPAMSSIISNKACHPTTQEVVADNPPDLTGWGFSPGDYVMSARGTCQTDGRPTRW